MDSECTFDAVPHPHAQYPGGNDREGDYNQTHDRFPTNVPHAQTVTVSHFCVRGNDRKWVPPWIINAAFFVQLRSWMTPNPLIQARNVLELGWECVSPRGDHYGVSCDPHA